MNSQNIFTCGSNLSARQLITLVLVCLTLFGLPACKSSYDKGYKQGYEIGYDSGYNTGHSDGYKEGETAGYKSGYVTATGELIQDNGSVAVGQGILIAITMLSGIGFYYFMVKNYRQPVRIRLDNYAQYWNEKWCRRRTKRELERLKFSADDYSRIKAGTLIREAFSNVEESVTDEASRARVDDLKHQAFMDVHGLQSEMRHNTSSAIERLINEVETSNTLNNREKVELYADIESSIKQSMDIQQTKSSH